MNTILKGLPVYDSRKRDWVNVDVDLEIHEDSLARQLARKASNTRWGQATIAGGAVKVTIRGWLGHPGGYVDPDR